MFNSTALIQVSSNGINSTRLVDCKLIILRLGPEKVKLMVHYESKKGARNYGAYVLSHWASGKQLGLIKGRLSGVRVLKREAQAIVDELCERHGWERILTVMNKEPVVNPAQGVDDSNVL